MPTTFDRLAAIVARDYKLPPERLVPEAALDSLGIDSLGTVELLWNVEQAFGITLPTEPVALAALGEVAGFIDGLVAARGGGGGGGGGGGEATLPAQAASP
jgi:acyl carrier protein